MLGSGGVEEGVHHPVFFSASSLQHSNLLFQLRSRVSQGDCLGPRGECHAPEGSVGGFPSGSGLLQPTIWGHEARWEVPSCDRPVVSQQVRSQDGIQDGDLCLGPSVHSEGHTSFEFYVLAFPQLPRFSLESWLLSLVSFIVKVFGCSHTWTTG